MLVSKLYLSASYAYTNIYLYECNYITISPSVLQFYPVFLVKVKQWLGLLSEQLFEQNIFFVNPKNSEK